MFEIEKDCPIPPRTGTVTKYPFAGMEVGDSFYIPPEISRNTISSNAYSWGRRNNMTFSIRKEGEGLRCWRTA